MDITNLDKKDLVILVKKLKLLNSLKKSLWNRWIREYKKINEGKDIFKVEYFDFGPETTHYIKDKAIEIFKKLFWLNLQLTQIEFVKNQNLQWWMRIFYNDNMFDLSYNRFQNLLK
jgi:hypothetical protein